MLDTLDKKQDPREAHGQDRRNGGRIRKTGPPGAGKACSCAPRSTDRRSGPVARVFCAFRASALIRIHAGLDPEIHEHWLMFADLRLVFYFQRRMMQLFRCVLPISLISSRRGQ
jgi:hypothetical protein